MIITITFIVSCLFTVVVLFSPLALSRDDLTGEWQLLQTSIGISAMHMQVLRNDQVVMFDRTDFGSSNLSLPHGRCRHDDNEIALKTDCSAHSVLYDVGTNCFRPLMVQTDTFCSSGSVLPNGTLVQTGGYNDGDHIIRMFTPCSDSNCDWVEFPNYLSQRRWYATNQILPDGRIIIVGGRRQFNYEFYPRNSRGSNSYRLTFLSQTMDSDENNLYPFVHLLPDGNLFIFANTRSISLDYKRNRVVKQFPPISDGNPRNYPSSGSSVLLPIIENQTVVAEVLICGGAPLGSFSQAAHGDFGGATSSCGRLRVHDDDPKWLMEDMPLGRVMGDMLLLPTGDIIIINGAGSGTAGWEYARSPVTSPVIYRPFANLTARFSVMSESSRPRMYHSSAVLLPDGRILVGGSNPHVYYNFTKVLYPTELSLEAYSPPYKSSLYRSLRPEIVSAREMIAYRESFSVVFSVSSYRPDSVVTVRIVAPSFSTHSIGMNQRMVVLKGRGRGVMHEEGNLYSLGLVGPSKPEIAPPGYYMLFVVHDDIPSHGVWVRIH